MSREIKFLFSLWKANLLAAMEFRLPFISQIIGMMLNNGFYFLFWIIFFDRFQEVRGWNLSDMFLVFGVAASSFGLVAFLFGNALNLSEIIAQGRLDYYLSLPRPVLLHTVASRSISSGLGDFIYGILSYLLSGQFGWDGLARFLFGVLLAGVVFLSFMIIIHSLTFWLGNTTGLANLLMSAMLTFTLYPASLFDGPAKLILFTIIPAALMGSLPASLVHNFSWIGLLELLFGAVVLLALSICIFQSGLRRYESGSAIQIEV